VEAGIKGSKPIRVKLKEPALVATVSFKRSELKEF
jgi:hypothetical protein